MTSAIKTVTPAPIGAEYQEQMKQYVRNNRLSPKGATAKAGPSPGLPEDSVTLSTGRSDAVAPPIRLKPSQPVSQAEKQALYTQFSVYA